MDDKPGEPAGMAPETPGAAPAPAPKLPTPEQAADVVITAVKSEDGAAMRALAAKDDPDPWLVADELIRRGEFDAAVAFATAAPRADVEALPGYVNASRGRAPDADERALLAAITKAQMAGEPRRMLEGTTERTEGIDSVVRIRLLHSRGNALWSLQRWAECATTLTRASDAALALGWLRRASALRQGAAEAAFNASDWAGSLQCLEPLLGLERRRGDARAEAVVIGRIGVVRAQMRDLVGALVAFEDAAARFEAQHDEENLAWVLRQTVLLHRSGGEFGKELAVLERELVAEEGRGDEAAACNTINDIGIVYAKLKEPAKARSAHERALARNEARGDKAATAGSLVNLGNVCLDLRDLPRARQCYERGFALAEEVGQRVWAKNALHGLGRACLELGDLTRASAVSQDLLERCREQKDDAGAARALFLVALTHERGAEYEKARSAFELALAAQEAVGERDAAAASLCHLGEVHDKLGDHAAALSSYERAMATYEALGDKAGAALALGNIGGQQRLLGDFEKALSSLGRALAAKEALEDRAGAASMLELMGIVCYERGDYAKARSTLELALAAQEAIGEKTGAAETLSYLANLEDLSGNYAKALETGERAMAAYEALGNRGGAALALGNIGNIYRELGDHAKALSTYERALKAKEALGDKSGAAETLGNIGLVYQSLGDYEKALTTHQRALAAKEALNDKGGAATTLGNIGIVYRELGDYAKALSTYERVLAAKETLNDRAGTATTLGNMGSVYYALGDYERALSMFERTLAAQEALGDKHGAAGARCNVASVYDTLGNHAKALSLHQRALAEQEALGDRHGAAVTLGNIGGDYVSMGETAKAISMLERALAAHEALGERAPAAEILVNIGVCHLGSRQFEKAIAVLDRAARQAERLHATEVHVRALAALARARLSAGDAGRAAENAHTAVRELDTMLGGLAEEQGAGARERFAGLFSTGAEAAAVVGDAGEAEFFLESGRAGTLLEALGGRESMRRAAIPDDLRAEKAAAAAGEALALRDYQTTLDGGDLKAARAAVKALDAAKDRVRAVIERIQRDAKHAAGVWYPRAAPVDEVQRWLVEGDAFVLYGVLGEDALALVVTRAEARIVSLGRSSEIRDACESLDATDLGADPAPALARLRELLVKPLGLQTSKPARLLVSPEGPLSYVPFSALVPDLPLVVVPSATTYGLLLDGEGTKRGEAVLAVGDPDYGSPRDESAVATYGRSGSRLAQLPQTREEARAVGDVRAARQGRVRGAAVGDAARARAVAGGPPRLPRARSTPSGRRSPRSRYRPTRATTGS